MLRKLLDRVAPLFHKGGKYERLYPLYEAKDTFLYTTGEVTHGKTHVRDAIDTKRMMSMVIVALIPCIIMACYNTGYQAQKILQARGPEFSPLVAHETEGLGALMTSCWNGNWRYNVMDAIGVDYRNPGRGFLDLSRMIPCFIHGLLFFLPVYIVTMGVGGICEVIFSVIRRHEINEGFLVTGMLFPLTLPPNIPLWQVALGIAFGVVIGKEIFGGTGRNFLNPALTGRAFLYFAYAKEISGDSVWTAVQGYSGATALGAIAEAKSGTVPEIVSGLSTSIPGQSWWQCFIGDMHGSMGETSTLCCLIGAAILIWTRIGSWRIMAGTVLGMAGLSLLLWVLPFSKPVFSFAPWWHLVLGGFAFGAVFMATDPVSASMTELGKWYYGVLIGVTTVIVRSINPAFPEGIMLAILFANVFAPLIDYFVVQQNIKRRAARYAA
ncbi:MAG TPA: NADH:ubiquinone reductase (Na(+)-transporting) subunit B [Pirellulaceae bacterium]|nr:NADH:ubiquinone reductase (Na(+)-transporting) subunit B [Pirellulaceae bacterium]